VAWFYTVLLAGCSAGIVVLGAVMTHRIFRDEALAADPADPADTPTDGSR
jgi:hypothetical protein